jgi:hypothetical protein
MEVCFVFLLDVQLHHPLLNTAVDFRARLRFPRVTREPPQLRFRGLTLATSPAGVFVLHSNQLLEQAKY